jgi:hypothetical protein
MRPNPRSLKKHRDARTPAIASPARISVAARSARLRMGRPHRRHLGLRGLARRQTHGVRIARRRRRGVGHRIRHADRPWPDRRGGGSRLRGDGRRRRVISVHASGRVTLWDLRDFGPCRTSVKFSAGSCRTLDVGTSPVRWRSRRTGNASWWPDGRVSCAASFCRLRKRAHGDATGAVSCDNG